LHHDDDNVSRISLHKPMFICQQQDNRWRPCSSAIIRPAFLKLWSADHKWSSGSALVVILDWTLVQKRPKK